jgi:hypothetical protein
VSGVTWFDHHATDSRHHVHEFVVEVKLRLTVGCKPWNSWPDFSFRSGICGLLDVGHPLWREDGSVIYSYNCFWALPEQSLSASELRRAHDHILLPHLRLPQPGGPGPHIYILQQQGGPVIPPGTAFAFHRLLRLAGLTPLHTGNEVWGNTDLYIYCNGCKWVYVLVCWGGEVGVEADRREA